MERMRARARRRKLVDLSSGKWSAFFAALCFEIAACINTAVYMGLIAGQPPRPSAQRGFLDEDLLEESWKWNQHVFPSLMAFDFFISAGLLSLLHSITCLKKLYRGHNGTAQNLLVTCFSLGALLPAIEFLQNLGARSTAVWIFKMTESVIYNLKSLKTLHIAYILGVSRLLWVFALIYVFVSVGMCLQAYLAFTTRASPKWHAFVGILASLVGFGAFGLNVIISNRWIGNLWGTWGLVSLFWGVLLLPLWTVGIGLRLGDEEEYKDFSSLEEDVMMRPLASSS